MRKLTLKYGINTSFAIAVIVGIVVFIEAISYRHYKSFDLTGSKRYTISAQSKKIVSSLTQNVKITGFFNATQKAEQQALRDLLNQYSYHSTKFSFEFIDPDKHPGKAKRYEITSYGTTVVESGEKDEKIFDTREEKVTNAILKVIRKRKKVIYFAKGHGEKNIKDLNEQGYSFAKQAIEVSNYEVKELVLATIETIPDDVDLLIIAGPQKPILNTELETIKKHLSVGGKVFFMIDPGTASELVSFLENFGISIQDDIVVDKVSRIFGVDPTMPVITQYGKHPIVKDFSVATFFPLARSVDMTINPVANMSVTSLVKTSPNSWAETDLDRFQSGEASYQENQDRKGPISIGVVVSLNKKKKVEAPRGNPAHAFEQPAKIIEDDTKKKEGRIVVMGDSDFATNSRIHVLGNSDFFLNIISWLLEEEDLISIRPKESTGKVFTLSDAQKKMIFWIPLVVVPGLVIFSGIAVYRKRKNMQ